MKRKTSAKFPTVSKTDADSIRKTEAVLFRLTKRDKETIVASASALQLTVTEFVTKSALLVAEKLGK